MNLRLAFFAIAASCSVVVMAKPAPNYLPENVQEMAEQLDGKKIVVRGWLPYCHRLGCPLFNSRQDAEKAEQGLDGVGWVGIGSSRSFDRAVWHKTPAEIVLVARVNARCINPPPPKMKGDMQIITVCADRTDDLKPIKILELKPAAMQPSGME